MKYYISDLHFCHKNILRFDERPWFDLSSMEDDLISLWNSKVGKNDDIYILGDLCWGLAEDWRRIIPKLHGRKHLIRGNHDLPKIPEDISKLFASISAYKEVKDNGYTVLMSHYPMVIYRHDVDPKVVMLYGHVHNTHEFEAIKAAIEAVREFYKDSRYNYQGQLYNCWGGFFDWAPATLFEIMHNSRTH